MSKVIFDTDIVRQIPVIVANKSQICTKVGCTDSLRVRSCSVSFELVKAGRGGEEGGRGAGGGRPLIISHPEVIFPFPLKRRP
jgi:hypothetical protein